LDDPPGEGEAPLGGDPVVSLPGVAPLVPPGGEPGELPGGVLDAPPGGVVALPAELVSPAPPAVPVPLVPPAPGVLAVPGELELLGGGVVVLALLLGLADGLVGELEVPAPAAGAVSSFLPHPPSARLATRAPSNNEYFIFM
jgi:hypothetical protein